MKIDLDELERKAQAATPGPWIVEREPCGWISVFREHGTMVFRGDSDPRFQFDAAHIAAASPPVVLALIARIRELEAELGKVLASARPHPVEHPTMTAAWESARVVLGKGAVLP